ncbi:MAG TPA: hypothetical protein VJ752_13430 [Burkholderiaceae bacterium]|nr:hypothetical protein [Burkholderiaceae bacterium]
MDTSKLMFVIEGFDQWERPWEFHSTVAESVELISEDRELFERVWAFACDRKFWFEAPLGASELHVQSELMAAFPWLSPLAAKQVSNGAAYQWR